MSNSRPKATLEIDIADLPMIVHALSIARATAMMCTRGDRHRNRVDALHRKLVEMTPPAALKFDEYHFCSMVMRVDEGQNYTVCAEATSVWASTYVARVKFTATDGISLADATYETERHSSKEEAEQIAKDIGALLDQIKPL